jgi:hypothetical protein
MAKSYVVSTLTSDQAYTLFFKKDDDGKSIPRADKVVIVKGGHGVANKNIITPKGVATAITEEQAKLLEENAAFKRHEKRGFVRILKKNPGDTEKASSDLSQRDGSAPLVEGDFAGGKAPKTGDDVEV